MRLLLGITSILFAFEMQTASAASCRYEVGSDALLKIAKGEADDRITESEPGECFLSEQAKALKDKIALDTCKYDFKLKEENKEAFELLTSAPDKSLEQPYGEKHAERLQKLAASFEKQGCQKRAKTYFPFNAEGQSSYIKLIPQYPRVSSSQSTSLGNQYSCSFLDDGKGLSQIANGEKALEQEETTDGVCFSLYQHRAILDNVMFETCPEQFKVRLDRRNIFKKLITSYMPEIPTDLVSNFTRAIESQVESLEMFGCEQQAEGYVPFYANGKTDFIERIN